MPGKGFDVGDGDNGDGQAQAQTDVRVYRAGPTHWERMEPGEDVWSWDVRVFVGAYRVTGEVAVPAGSLEEAESRFPDAMRAFVDQQMEKIRMKRFGVGGKGPRIRT